jgi:extradiol dioxygenase family protein
LSVRCEIVSDIDRIHEIHAKWCPSRRLVDQFGYRAATLSSAFSDVFAVVAYVGQTVVGVLPLCRYNGELQVVGQFWAEGYGLYLSLEVWAAMRERLGVPVGIRYAGLKLVDFECMDVEQAVLYLPDVGQTAFYFDLFRGSDSKRILRQALAWKDKTVTSVRLRLGPRDIDLLVRFSQERLGEKSRFLEPQRVESIERLLVYAQKFGALRVMRYRLNDEDVAIAFLVYDRLDNTLTFLTGFSSGELDNFGKFMYLSFVELAEAVGVSRVIALSPMYRIKRDMKYQGKPLYSYEVTK